MLALVYTDEFKDQFDNFAKGMQQKILEKVRLLVENPAHPGLNTHRLKRSDGKWEFYVDMSRRIIYDVVGCLVRLWQVGDHTVVERSHRYSFASHTSFRRWEAILAEEEYTTEQIPSFEKRWDSDSGALTLGRWPLRLQN